VGNGTSLGDVDRIASHRQPGWHEIPEGDYLGDLAVKGYMKHAVMVPVSDDETVSVGFNRILEAAGHEEGGHRGMGSGPCANIRYDGMAIRTVHPVDAYDVVTIKIRRNTGNQRICSPASEGDIDHSTTNVE